MINFFELREANWLIVGTRKMIFFKLYFFTLILKAFCFTALFSYLWQLNKL